MFLLIEILDGSDPTELNERTYVDLMAFEKQSDAVIYVEPQNMEHMDCVILDRNGVFGLVPKTDKAEIPELVQKWCDPVLATELFNRYHEGKRG